MPYGIHGCWSKLVFWSAENLNQQQYIIFMTMILCWQSHCPLRTMHFLWDQKQFSLTTPFSFSPNSYPNSLLMFCVSDKQSDFIPFSSTWLSTGFPTENPLHNHIQRLIRQAIAFYVHLYETKYTNYMKTQGEPKNSLKCALWHPVTKCLCEAFSHESPEKFSPICSFVMWHFPADLRAVYI